MGRFFAVGGLLAAGLGFANRGDRFDVKTGLWEVTASFTSTAPGGEGLGSRAKLSGQKRTYCVTEQDLETGNLLDHVSGCSQKVRSSSDRLTVNSKCPAPYGAKSSKTSEFDRVDQENFKGRIRMKEEGTTQTLVGKWLRAACEQ